MSDMSLEFSIATANDTSDWRYGQRFLETLIATDKRLTPKIINHNAKYENISSCRPFWAARKMVTGPAGTLELIMPFHWKRNSTLKSSGTADFAKRNIAGKLNCGGINILSDFDGKTDWLKLFKTTCELMEPVGGVLHLLTEPEIRRHPQIQGITSPYYLPVQSDVFEAQKMPNIAWATYFGEPLRKEVDAEKLRAHGYYVEELAGGYLILMSEKLSDLVDDFWTFSQRRAELKKLFRPGFFRIAEEPVREQDNISAVPEKVVMPEATPTSATPSVDSLPMSNPREDCLKLALAALPFALDMLKKNGGFYPYGWIMRTDGQFETVGAHDDKLNSDQAQAFIKAFFDDGARKGTLRATAMVLDSTFTLQQGQKADVIAIGLCHVEGYAVTYVYPYMRQTDGDIVLGTGFPQPRANDVFSDRNKG